MKTALLVINKDGQKLAEKVKKGLESSDIIFLKAGDSNLMEKIFRQYEGLVFFAALGIVIRLISPLIKSKFTDPAVVCVDTAGRFSISLLCGHEGGANQLAFEIAEKLDAQPVITTGTEAHKNIILGVGCRRGISAEKIKTAIVQVLEDKNICLEQIRLAATVDIKKNDPGLRQAFTEMGLPLIFITRQDIKNFQGAISPSPVVKKHLGIWGVSEPCALIAGRRTKLISPKKIISGITIALAQEN